MKNTLATLVTAAALALAGCAADASEPSTESTNDSQGATTVVDDHFHSVLSNTAGQNVGVGGAGGVTAADDPQKRMYDFDPTPRITQRAPWEEKLSQLNNASVVTFGDTKLDGTQVRRSSDTQASINGPN